MRGARGTTATLIAAVPPKGADVQVRILIATSAAIVCAACANERPPQVLGYHAQLQAAPQHTASLAGEPAQAQPQDMKKTMASKVLAAIALERVTGRKPDPSRLAEVN